MRTTDQAVGGSGPGFYAPFLIGDLLLLIAAWMIHRQADIPMDAATVGAFAACVALGACLGVAPFILRYRADLRRFQTVALSSALERCQQIEEVARSITAATGQWQAIQDQAAKSVTASREIAERVGVERSDFQAFLEKANDQERQHLNVQVDKLRRAEGEWLQVLVRIMDHVYALHQAAVRSEQENLIVQFGQFQDACRDIARRVGFVAIVAEPGEPFDPNRHQTPDPEATVPDDAVVTETLATGFAFQGQILRLPVVAIHSPTDTAPVDVPFTDQSPSPKADATPPASTAWEQPGFPDATPFAGDDTPSP